MTSRRWFNTLTKLVHYDGNEITTPSQSRHRIIHYVRTFHVFIIWYRLVLPIICIVIHRDWSNDMIAPVVMYWPERVWKNCIVQTSIRLECGTWYHHPRRLLCVLSRNLRIFKVATWHYRCRHNLNNNCIWDNLQCCLLVPRSHSKPVMLTFDLQSRKV